jgi:hypothetical protein
MNSVSVEKPNNNFFENALALIQTEFSEVGDIEISLKPSNEYKAYLAIRFTGNDGKNYVSDDRVEDATFRIDKILKAEGLELGRVMGMSNWSIEYMISPRIVHGKINWRRYVPYPQNLSEDSQKLLDEVAGFTELQEEIDRCGYDSLGKYGYFVRLAQDRGLLTKEEAREIEFQNNKVANA